MGPLPAPPITREASGGPEPLQDVRSCVNDPVLQGTPEASLSPVQPEPLLPPKESGMI